jgi:probable F420-dependent oxidoreductase
MKYGLFGINFGPCAVPETAVRIAQAAEAAGFESVWTGEHVVLPDPQVPPSPVPPHTPMLDPAVALAFLAGATQRVRLGTGIIILPQRNPLVLAKELASVDVLSRGRLIVGVGAGYLQPEFDALGIPLADRGARTNEYIEVMGALWTMEHPRHAGRFYSFGGIDAHPRPVQQPHPPIVIGGLSPQAYRRAVRQCNGWYGFAIDLEQTAQCVKGLANAARRYARPPALGMLEVSVTPRGRLDAETVQRFADLGVHRLIATTRATAADDLLRVVDTVGGLMGSAG